MAKALNHSSILSIEKLSVSRDDTDILNGINWTIKKGEQWAVLGANGCGKTSLLTAITAYVSPNAGKIQLLGKTYSEDDWAEVRERIGMVSSALARRIPADELALETVLSGTTAQLGYWTREKRVDTKLAFKCLKQMGVAELAERKWAVLSQGERQKVFIARALITKPALLILDEPCAGLDPVAREKLLQSLRAIAQAKRPPQQILVTHHIEEIFPEITHVLLLKNGQVLAAGAKAKVLNSQNLSSAFDAEIKLRKQPQQTYSLKVQL